MDVLVTGAAGSQGGAVAHALAAAGHAVLLASVAGAGRPTGMAAALAAATGHDVRAERVPLADVRARSEDLAAMHAFLEEEGPAVDLDALRAAHPAVAWTPFAAWAAAQSWTPSEQRRGA